MDLKKSRIVVEVRRPARRFLIACGVGWLVWTVGVVMFVVGRPELAVVCLPVFFGCGAVVLTSPYNRRRRFWRDGVRGAVDESGWPTRLTLMVVALPLVLGLGLFTAAIVFGWFPET